MKISIIGTGYVGLVTGTCLADFGLSVTCVDQDEQKINILNSGGIPIYEPNLEALIKKNISAGRLTFTTDLEDAVRKSKVIFIAVGTPSNNDGSANLQQIEKVAQQIAAYMNEYKVIVNKSTVPIGTATKIKEIINKYQTLSLRATEGSAAIPSSVIPASSSVIPAKAGIHPSSPSPLRGEGGVKVKHPSVIARSEATRQSQPPSKPFDFDIVSNPEFLREGSAVYDFTHPDKIVIGTTSPKALKIMQEIYRKCFDPLAADALSLVSSDREYQHFAPTNLLLYEVACWGCENGYKTFHLGGGLDSKEDSLYKFKSAFNRNSDNTFSIGR